jgi:hypothetical protein
VANREWRRLGNKELPITNALRQWMLPCVEVTGARGYQDENLLLPLMIRTLSFSPPPRFRNYR